MLTTARRIDLPAKENEDSPSASIFEAGDGPENEAAVEAAEDPEEPEEAAAGYEPDDDLNTGAGCGTVVKYDGGEYLGGIPSREEIVAEQDKDGLSRKLETFLSECKKVFFMPTDTEDSTEFEDRHPTYVLRIFGALMDGSKAEVIITGIDVFFDVRISPSEEDRLVQTLHDVGVNIPGNGRMESIKAFPGRGYHTAEQNYRRIYLNSLKLRKDAIARVREAGFETASDDRTCYYRKAARENNLPLCDWAILDGYDYEKGPTARSPLCAHVLRVPVGSYRPLIDGAADKARREKAAEAKSGNPLLAKDRTLVLTFDTETHSKRGLGDLPLPEHDSDSIFMLAMTAHWKDDPAPLKRLVLVDVDTAPDARWLTVVCGSPENILRAFALCYQALAPDICIGFNDSEYDWKFIVEKANKFAILGWMWNIMSAKPRKTTTDASVMNWNYRVGCRIKISAEQVFYSSFLKIPGSVSLDTRVCYKKIYTRSETPKAGSLRFYLEDNGLPSKADMPIKLMWKHYEAAAALHEAGAPATAETAEHMRHVAHYCVIDALRCQHLMVRRNILNDMREVGSLAYVNLYDCHYYAGGMKVRNLMGAYAWRRRILNSSISIDRGVTGKYPGAHVFPPEKGIVPDPVRFAALDSAAAAMRQAIAARDPAAAETHRLEVLAACAAMARDRPITGLDFSSLYPSIIMAFNLSPEKILLTEEQAGYWAAQGLSLHPISFMFGGEPVRGWSVRHGNDPAQIGLYPAVLIDLFNKRAEMKVILAKLGSVKELIELVYDTARKAPEGSKASRVSWAARARLREAAAVAAETAPGGALRVPPGSTEDEERQDLKRRNQNAAEQGAELQRLLAAAPENDDAALGDAIDQEFKRVSFELSCIDAKQRALKTYMNTFYGEAGNSLSPDFMIELAGGVTQAGRDSIKMIAEFVLKENFRIKYGDSVTGDTALIVRNNGVISTCRIDELVSDRQWRRHREDKECVRISGLEVWQDGGFTPVTRVIRHACEKPIARVITPTGVVDCTNDHSLLLPDGAKVSPRRVDVGTELLHVDDGPLLEAVRGGEFPCDDREAFAMGLFTAFGFADGEAWHIAGADLKSLKTAAAGLPFPTKIVADRLLYDTECAKNPSASSPKTVSSHFRAIFYNQNGEKRVPGFLLSADPSIIDRFWCGFRAGDVCEPDGGWIVVRPGKELCTGLWLLGRRLGWFADLDEAENGQYRIRFMDYIKFSGERTRIQAMRTLEPAPFVFDLETESHHFHVGPGNLVVHNTDSLYVQAPDAVFAECDMDYALGRLDRETYMAAQVRITIRTLNHLRNKVNEYLSRTNGTKYLKMAYEEVLYPATFTGKKKYFGIPHLNEVNFRPKDLFIRGIDVVKQGQPGLARTIGFNIMWGAMSITNDLSLQQRVERVLRDAVVNVSQWNFEHFVKTDTWKPHKNNVAVHRFVARTRARHAIEIAQSAAARARGETPRPFRHELPEAGERFRYVIVKLGESFGLEGRKVTLIKGDRMEFARNATLADIDVAYYMNSNVVGLCARFINSDAQFLPPNAENMDDKKVDQVTWKAAKKHLENLVASIGHGGGGVMAKRGSAYRRAYRRAADSAYSALAARVGFGAEILHGPRLNYTMFSAAAGAQGEFWEAARSAAAETAAAEAAGWCRGVGLALGFGADGSDSAADGDSAVSLYGNAEPGRRRALPATTAGFLSALDRVEAELREKIEKVAADMSDLAIRYETDLSASVQQQRLEEHRAHPEIGDMDNSRADLAPEAVPLMASIGAADAALLAAFRGLWYGAVGVLLVREREARFAEYVGELKGRRLKIPRAPARADRPALIAAAAATAKIKLARAAL